MIIALLVNLVTYIQSRIVYVRLGWNIFFGMETASKSSLATKLTPGSALSSASDALLEGLSPLSLWIFQC